MKQVADGLALGYEFPDGARVRYAGDGLTRPLIDTENDCITVPMEYTMLTKSVDGEHVQALAPAPGIAAYAVDLLDEHVPGLYEAMKASRTDTAAYRQVIQMIDGVRPGLYRELTHLPYSARGFQEGLKLVAAALEGDKDTANKPD